MWLNLQAMTAGFEASSRQMKGNSRHGQQGSMVTLALVCGHHLTVATAGTSQAHLDTGSHIHMVSTALMHAAAPAALHEVAAAAPEIAILVKATIRLLFVLPTMHNKNSMLSCRQQLHFD